MTAAETETLRQLFLHDLGQLLRAEPALAGALGRLHDDAVDEELREAFAEHAAQTEGHLERLRRTFELLAEPAREEPCAGIDGLLREHQDFLAARRPAAIVLDMFLTGVAARVEHYEIAVYEGVAGAAAMLGEEQVAELLGRTLEEEQAALARVMQISERLTAQSLGREPPGGLGGWIKERLP